MKKIIIVNNGTLPIPSVKGGAVESLIDLLLNENEKSGLFRFEVFSIYDIAAVKESKKYKFTTFTYVKTNSTAYKLDYIKKRIVNFIYLRTNGFYHSFKLYDEIVKKVNKNKQEYAAILLEGSSINTCYLKKKTGLPIISRYHNLPRRKLRHFDIYNAKSTDLYIGISEYVCNELRQFEGKYCQHIERLYNSVDFKKFQHDLNNEEKQVLLKNLGFNGSDFIVMFAGRMEEYKGIKQLLEAMLLCSEIPNIKLLVVGSAYFSSDVKTPFEKSLSPIIEKLGNKVSFTGYVSYNNMWKYYKLADICVFPSTWEEPFALTCLEALLCGKPVIITKSGGMKEIVNDKCAIVIPNDSEIPTNIAKSLKDIISNKKNLIKMSEAATERAEYFSPSKHFAKFTEIIEKYIINK